MSNIFSPNNHVRHSHYLQPEPQSQPFGRHTGGGFKSTLRKIPSALFNKDKSPHKEKSTNKENFRVYVDPPVKQPMKKIETTNITQPPPSVPKVDVDLKEKVKTKNKPRKALADIFHWGNHSHQPPAATLPSKSVAPTVPPKDTAMLKKFNRPASTKSSHSQVSSLRPPVEPLASRTSMGDDPFMRNGEGAEIVDHVFRRDIQSPSVKSISFDRRSSMSSAKALSTKTVLSDCLKEVKERPSSSEAQPVVNCARVPPALTLNDTLVDLPPRSASLGKVFGTHQTATPLPILPEVPSEAEEAGKTLKREKTKSRVWGLLGRRRSKKSKDQADIKSDLPVESKDTWAKPSAIPVNSSLAAQIDEKYAAAAVKSNASSMRSSSRPRPPILHVSAPSADTGAVIEPRTSSTMSFPRTAQDPTFGSRLSHYTQDAPANHPVSSGQGGVWESVVGSMADRPSEEGTRHAIEALMGPNRLPKRKSLSGLFGLAIKKSMDRIKPTSPPRAGSSRNHVSPPRLVVQPALKSLAEEIEESEVAKQGGTSGGFASRFGLSLANNQTQGMIRSDGLHHVAAATHKLLNLVTELDFSPASTNSPTVHLATSTDSLRQAFNGSPTPVRRIKSAMLSNKASSTSLKPSSANVSPLKLALHRSQLIRKVKSRETSAATTPSPPRQSMVRKGMRNIFAPPSPAGPKLHKSVENLLPKATEARIVKGRSMGPARIGAKQSTASDVPADLKAIIINTDAENSAPSPTKRTSLGLPPPPPSDRVSPRRPAVAPPALSLPPEPDVPSHSNGLVTLNIEKPLDERDSVLSDMLTIGGNDFRNSFDFTNEYAALDQGDHRASFVEALKKVESMQLPIETSAPPVPVLLPMRVPSSPAKDAIPSFYVSKPSDCISSDEEDWEEDEEEEEGLEDTAVIHHVVGIARTSPVRKEPFRGQFSFQQHMSITQASHASFGAPEPAVTVKDPAPEANNRRRGHRRGESSIATMSSIGDVIGTNNEREYTNYFDFNFASHLSHNRQNSRAEIIEEVETEQSPRRSPSRDSMSSFRFGAQTTTRPTTRRGHHRRNSSIQSVDSIGDNDAMSMTSGPPISMHNNHRRSGYISKHRRDSSSIDSTFGRPDWAAHRRNSSTASTASNVSASQIVRPGLGDRMFQRDGGVQLTSITGSPPDDTAGTHSKHHRGLSWDSLFDNTQVKANDSLFDSAPDSIFDSSAQHSRVSSDRDSLFGPEQQSARNSFFLRGLRPVSTVSTATNSTRPDDTFGNGSRWSVEASPVRKIEQEIEKCLEAAGENMSNMTPLGKGKTVAGRQMLGSSMSRPARPGRRRPAHLVLADLPMDTPGLTSPSASETSSRLSLDTNAASITLGTRTRPRGSGHYRQKSSAGVRIDATIHEMPSMATLRANKSSTSPSVRAKNSRSSLRDREPTIIGGDGLTEDDGSDKMKSVRRWIEWEREAVDEFRKTKSCWVDSDESKHALEDWKMPKTTEEIAAFLAQSTQAYKPLNQLPLGRGIAHRRKSSLSDSRALCSPYGLPLPKPSAPINKPKMSLTTKYEKKNSTSSSTSASSTFAFAFPDDVPEPPSAPPLSAVFAAFARETPPTPAPKIAPFQSLSPLTLSSPTPDAFGLRKQLEVEQNKTAKEKEDDSRPRVTSNARRAALGWGRRRNSDGPEKVIAIGREKAPTVPLIPRSERNKENVNINTVMTGRSTAFSKMTIGNNVKDNTRVSKPRGQTPAKRRGPRQVASQPLGLRV
ncbi:hypothetical protein CI109_103683 [Kwoniella shandongensis]|uniref:Uncharacterized protein n=1 Tax=Kwoniella shandongensis TaxID=1734106 RepID=A0AAJ8MX39_9TREE